MKHSIAVLVEDRPGVLTHISGLISRRGYNIVSIAASATEVASVTRISVVVEVSRREELEQILAQLAKLCQVIKVVELSSMDHISRELALVKVQATPENRADITNIVDIFRAKIVDVHPKTMVIEVTGEEEKVDAFCNLMEQKGIVEIIRTGQIFLSRDELAASHDIDDL